MKTKPEGMPEWYFKIPDWVKILVGAIIGAVIANIFFL